MTKHPVAKGRGHWSNATKGVLRRQWVFVVASAIVINLVILVILMMLARHTPFELTPAGIVGYVLAPLIVAPTMPLGWIAGLFAGPAIHGVVYRRLEQADHHYRRGVEAYEAERPDEAIAELTRALDLSGGEGKSMKWDAQAYAYRAGAYAMREDIERAVSDLEKAQSLTRDPDLTAHVERQLQELRAEIGHGRSQPLEEALGA